MWLLLRLDPKSDPVWDYLCDKERRVRGLLEGCVREHKAKFTAVQKKAQERREESARWLALQEKTRRELGRVSADTGSGVLVTYLALWRSQSGH